MTTEGLAVGDVVTNVNPKNPTARIIETVVAIEQSDGSVKYHLSALYLGKRFARELITEDAEGYILATTEDHDLAKAYAERFNRQDLEE